MNLKNGEHIIYEKESGERLIGLWISDDEVVGYNYTTNSLLSDIECENVMSTLEVGLIEGFTLQ